MKSNNQRNKEQVPFIARFAESRKEARPLPGSYDDELDIFIINKGTDKIPLIKAFSCLEIQTKTEVARESDENSDHFILEPLTTTIQRESNDLNSSCIQDLRTKTFVERESDEDSSFLVELLTKTKVDREGDDYQIGF